jgi:hypothetical protein
MFFKSSASNSTRDKGLDMNSKISGGLVHELPSDLESQLIDSDLFSIWEGLSPIARNEFICWIEDTSHEIIWPT